MVLDFRIDLKDDKKAYYSGQSFWGTVSFELKDRLPVKGVVLNVLGVGVVHWWTPKKPKVKTKSSKEFSIDSKLHHEATEIYIDDEFWLLGDGMGTITLSPGKYSYPFDIQLPIQLPASFDSERGTIEYEITARLFPEYEQEHSTSIPLTVLGYLDLTHEDGALQAVSHSATETFRCCCNKGSMTMTVRFRQIGHLPLDPASYEVEVNNDSQVTIEGIEATLLRYTVYSAEDDTEETLEVICSAMGPPVFARTRMTWTEQRLVIPEVVPTRLGGHSKIINVRYLLQFQPQIDARCVPIPTVNAPIIIGTPRFRNPVIGLTPSAIKVKGGSISPANIFSPGVPNTLISKFMKQRRQSLSSDKSNKSTTEIIVAAHDTMGTWNNRPDSVMKLAALSKQTSLSSNKMNDSSIYAVATATTRSHDSSRGIYSSTIHNSSNK